MAINKILIVDDSATDLTVLQETLAQTHCMVITARSGAEAVKKSKSERPDLIFMDIVMENMNGYDACREIKADPETSHIPIVFVSSKNQKADHIWARRQGGDALISKPYNAQQIIDQVSKIS